MRMQDSGTRLDERRCRPCEGGVEPLSATEAERFLASVDRGWRLDDDGRCIERVFEFPAFSRTIAFVNAVAWIATVEGHHPTLEVEYGRCCVRYSTRAIGGLSENDFICAAKVDRLASDG